MADEESEDDYLTMTFNEPSSKPESSLQRAARLKREAEQRSHQPTKAERQAAQDEATRTALATRLDDSNKGAQMLKRMGFTGGALGRGDSNGRVEPIAVAIKADRAGIGIEDEKKRKLREAADQHESSRKRQKADENDYRKRLQTETEERRAEGQIVKAMRALEDLHAREMERRVADGGLEADVENVPIEKRPLHRVPLLYRPLIKRHREDEEERRRRPLLMVGRQNTDRPTTELERLIEAEKDSADAEIEEVDDEREDDELDDFLALTAVERLEQMVRELRQAYHYCFWCMHRYKDKDELEAECPGLTEEEHDA